MNDLMYMPDMNLWNTKLTLTNLSFPRIESDILPIPENFIYLDKVLLGTENYLRLHIDTGNGSNAPSFIGKYWASQYTSTEYAGKIMLFYNKGLPLFGVYFNPSKARTDQYMETNSNLNIYINPKIFDFTRVLPKLKLNSPSNEITSFTFNEEFFKWGTSPTTLDSTFTWTKIDVPNTQFEYKTNIVDTYYWSDVIYSAFSPGLSFNLGQVGENRYFNIVDSLGNILFKIEGYTTRGTGGTLKNARFWLNLNFFNFSNVFPEFYSFV